MSIEAAAEVLADNLSKADFVRVYGHHDADGIASASIICHALSRLGKKYHLTIKSGISAGDVSDETPTILCDLGSSLEDLAEDVMVVDHHLPRFSGEYHVNPRLHGIDGDNELSSSGAAFIVANCMGDNRDLCGLALLGIIGDGQAVTGKNEEIINEGIANQFITPGRGIPLPGRDPAEKLYTAIKPYLSGISGDKAKAEEISKLASGERGSPDSMLSSVILDIAEYSGEHAMQSVWGNIYEIERGAIHDAHTLAATVEGCGLSGRGGLGAALCMRSVRYREMAEETALSFRLSVISSLKDAKKKDENLPLFEIGSPKVSGSVADILSDDLVGDCPVFTIAKKDDGGYSVSARVPPGYGLNVGEFLEKLASECGGTGGGHVSRGGASFPKSGYPAFRKGIEGMFA